MTQKKHYVTISYTYSFSLSAGLYNSVYIMSNYSFVAPLVCFVLLCKYLSLQYLKLVLTEKFCCAGCVATLLVFIVNTIAIINKSVVHLS